MRNQITILSLDFGSSLGYSRVVCTLRPELQLNVVDHGTLYLDALANERMKKEYNDVYTRRRVKMIIYEEFLRKIVDTVKFDCFICEDVFCNPNRISAFRNLVLYMEVYERIINIEKHKRIYTVPAKTIKKYITGYGTADKSQVQAAVVANKSISIKHPANATEHEYDSIACTWAFVQEYLLTMV